MSRESSLPVVLVPALGASARLYAAQIPALWRFGPVPNSGHLSAIDQPEAVTAALVEWVSTAP